MVVQYDEFGTGQEYISDLSSAHFTARRQATRQGLRKPKMLTRIGFALYSHAKSKLGA